MKELPDSVTVMEKDPVVRERYQDTYVVDILPVIEREVRLI